MLSADTNMFIYAADPDSPNRAVAKRFFDREASPGKEFAICELVLVEIYMQLRNPAVCKVPYSAAEVAQYCQKLRESTGWRHIDYDPVVSRKLWGWAAKTKSGIREIIDARLAFTLRQHGVTRFATANVKHFKGFGFTEVWNLLAS